MKIITRLLQVILGLTFIVSGLAKVIDPVGTHIKLGEYLDHFQLGILSDWTMMFAWMLSVFEFVIGFYVVFGIRRRTVLSLLSLMMMVFLPLTLYLALDNPVDDCGCFGDAIVLTNWQTFAKNVVLVLIIAWLSFHARQMMRPLGKAAFTIYIYGVVAVALVLASMGTWRLPYIDFRPYRPGLDLRAAIAVPESSSSDDIYYCVYERGEERRIFALDSIPDETEGWEFVDVCQPADKPDFVQVLVRQQSDLGFFVLNGAGEEVTDAVVGAEGYTFLLLSPSLATASEHDIDRIENIYEYCIEEGHRFFCLTLNDPQAISHWRFRTGAEYEMLYTDATVIETMIRSNPGLMLVKDGVVLWKSHLAGVDVEALTSAKLSEHSLGQIQPISRKNRVLWIIFWLVAPLVLYLPLQFVKNNLSKKHKQKMRKKIVAGNWKMNTTLQEGVALAQGLKEALAGKTVNCDVVVCTPFISVAAVAEAVKGSVIGVGAEDCSAHDKGAYTGEVAANMVASTGAKYVILGHSERRQYHGENNEILVAKLQQALANGLTPIFCVGEVKEERENGTFKAVIEGQMEAMYTLSAEDFGKCIVAYEPVWAIGTGLTATSEQAQEVHAFIRASIAKKYNAEVADNCSILYGGSCKGSNAPELFAQPDIDGGLIGGAALKVDTFMPIIEAWK